MRQWRHSESLVLKFQSSSASEPAPDIFCIRDSLVYCCFNPRVRANPHPTIPIKSSRCSSSFNPRVRANPHPTRRVLWVNFYPHCFNPRVRANPHPTCAARHHPSHRRFQSSSASEPAPDVNRLGRRGEAILFQSSSASEPAPDVWRNKKQNIEQRVSILECERTRTRQFLEFADASNVVSILECERTRTRPARGQAPPSPHRRFNPRVRANPHPTVRFYVWCFWQGVSILECERTRTRPPNINQQYDQPYVSILECERTRTRQKSF